MSDIKLFISHSQRDEALAERFINLLKECLEVPSGAIRCSSVQGYKLDLGELLNSTLQAELKSAVDNAADKSRYRYVLTPEYKIDIGLR